MYQQIKTIMSFIKELFTKKWETIDFVYKVETQTVDNTKDPYYIKNGFHRYDCMTDISENTFDCTYKIQFNKNKKEYRVRHFGDFEDAELLKQAYSKIDEYKNKPFCHSHTILLSKVLLSK